MLDGSVGGSVRFRTIGLAFHDRTRIVPSDVMVSSAMQAPLLERARWKVATSQFTALAAVAYASEAVSFYGTSSKLSATAVMYASVPRAHRLQ